jgi:hypothetical protein
MGSVMWAAIRSPLTPFLPSIVAPNQEASPRCSKSGRASRPAAVPAPRCESVEIQFREQATKISATARMDAVLLAVSPARRVPPLAAGTGARSSGSGRATRASSVGIAPLAGSAKHHDLGGYFCYFRNPETPAPADGQPSHPRTRQLSAIRLLERGHSRRRGRRGENEVDDARAFGPPVSTRNTTGRAFSSSSWSTALRSGPTYWASSANIYARSSIGAVGSIAMCAMPSTGPQVAVNPHRPSTVPGWASAWAHPFSTRGPGIAGGRAGCASAPGAQLGGRS